MNDTLAEKLCHMFPCINTEENIGLQWGSVCDCEDGWYGLIVEMLEDIEKLYKNYNKSIDDFKVMQIKEKYGELRFYASSSVPGVQDIINHYERKSAKICELCGEPGSAQKHNGWIKTLCEKCADKNGYKQSNFKVVHL